jgi:hypothetical protein
VEYDRQRRMTWKNKGNQRGQTHRRYGLQLERTLPVTGRNVSIYLAVHGDVGDSSRGPLIEDADIGDALEMTSRR